jgi:hypothetical protein
VLQVNLSGLKKPTSRLWECGKVGGFLPSFPRLRVGGGKHASPFSTGCPQAAFPQPPTFGIPAAKTAPDYPQILPETLKVAISSDFESSSTYG